MLKRALSWFAGRKGPAFEGSAGACVLLVDPDGRISAFSNGAPGVAGVTAARLGGLPLTDLFRSQDRPAVMRALSLGGASGRVAAMTSGDGAAPRRLDLAVAVRADGKRSVLLLPAALESEQSTALRTEAETARSEAKDTADLLADLSHEMRTPLNAVIGFSGAMQSEMFGPIGHPKYEEYAGHIRASGQHLLDLVNAILDLAKIEADRFSLKRESVHIGKLVDECAGMVRLEAQSAGLRLVTHIEPGIPESFLDPRAVRQILLNLLSNAVKFTDAGDIVLSASTDGGDIVLTVTDTGVGMSARELAQLGARFTAAKGEGVRGAKGNGLGLSLAFALAELHGGRMTLKSAPGEGLAARVVLPIISPAAPARRRDSHGPNPALLTQLERIEAYRRERASAA